MRPKPTAGMRASDMGVGPVLLILAAVSQVIMPLGGAAPP